MWNEHQGQEGNRNGSNNSSYSDFSGRDSVKLPDEEIFGIHKEGPVILASIDRLALGNLALQFKDVDSLEINAKALQNLNGRVGETALREDF